MKTLIRDAWIQACQFHPWSDAQVLKEVLARVKSTPKPLVLLDLDSTLYEVGPRTHQILGEWVKHPDSRTFPEVRSALERMEVQHVGYSVRDTLAALGMATDKDEIAELHGALEAIRTFWGDRFFRSDYLKFDNAYEGAARFARDLHELGAELIYLTGRDEPGMGDGTRENLLRDGFPWEIDRTHLLLKKAAHLPDLDHKREAQHYIRQQGSLVASFENEPPNLIALSDLFPESMHVFVDTVCSDHPAEPRDGLYRIKSFEY
jgi:hypothetical protein